jgi:hypothetical protein
MQIEKKTAHPSTNAQLSQGNSNKDTAARSRVNSFKVSTVKSATFTETKDRDANDVLEAIRTGGKTLRGKIEQIRDKLRYGDASAKQLAQELKKQLPAVMWSGTFTERKNGALVKHSGLFCADLDKLGDTLQDVREKLGASPHVWAMFISPSGDGLKAVFRVPADAAQHAGSFRAAEQHIHELTSVQIDQACKDKARLCFLSYDPELYHNPSAVPIEPLPEPEKSPRPLGNGAVDLSARERIALELLGAIDRQGERSFVTCPGQHLHTTPNGKRDCELYLDNDGGKSPTIYCQHNSCNGIVEGVNFAFRSRIGKAEYVPNNTPFHGDVPETKQNLVTSVDVEAVHRPPAQTPYVPPSLTLLPAVLREYVQTAATAINVDVSFILLPILGALGSAIGNARSILLKRGFVQPPIVWTAIIGRSGSRKSPALKAACFAVTQHEITLARQNKTTEEVYEQDMAEWEKKDRKERGVKPVKKAPLTCLMDNLTLEALAQAIQENPRGVLVKKDELSHYFSSFDQYTNAKGADVSQWLSLHTGAFVGVDRRSDHRRYRIHDPRVCVTGGIQPQVLKRILTQDFFERGLPARFLFAGPPFRPDQWSEAEIPDSLQAKVAELFEKLWELQPKLDDNDNQQPVEVTLDPGAKATFVAYYNECGDFSANGDEHSEAAWGKLSGYAARLALIAQLAHDPDAKVITVEVMQAACDLARWFGNEAQRIYAMLAELPEQRETRKLVEFIQSRGGSVTVRDLMQSYWPLKNNKDGAERALNALVKKQLANSREIKPEGRGRPTVKFQLTQPSTSTQFPDLRGKIANSVDVEVPKTVQNTCPEEVVSRPQSAVSEEPQRPPECYGTWDDKCPCEYCNQERLINDTGALFNATAAT